MIILKLSNIKSLFDQHAVHHSNHLDGCTNEKIGIKSRGTTPTFTLRENCVRACGPGQGTQKTDLKCCLSLIERVKVLHNVVHCLVQDYRWDYVKIVCFDSLEQYRRCPCPSTKLPPVKPDNLCASVGIAELPFKEMPRPPTSQFWKGSDVSARVKMLKSINPPNLGDLVFDKGMFLYGFQRGNFYLDLSMTGRALHSACRRGVARMMKKHKKMEVTGLLLARRTTRKLKTDAATFQTLWFIT